MSSKEQGSITGKLTIEPSTPFIQYSPFQLSDRVGEIKERGKKGISQMFIQKYPFHTDLHSMQMPNGF